MTERSERLQRLDALATETGAEKRRALIAELAAVYREPRTAPPREMQEIGEGLTRLLPKLSLAERTQLSAEIAPLRGAPTYLVRQLANDAPEVAAPILAESPLLTDEDLLASARKGGGARIAALARRPGVPAELQLQVIESGDAAAVTALLESKAFRVSPATLPALIVRARKDGATARFLAAHADVPVVAKAELFFQLGPRERLALTHQLADAPAPAKPRSAPPESETALMRAARAGDRKGLALALAKACELSEAFAERALRDPGGEALAVLCIACGIARPVFSSILVLTRPEASEASAKPNAALTLYDRVSPQGARRLALEWQRAAPLASNAAPARAEASSEPRTAPGLIAKRRDKPGQEPKRSSTKLSGL